MNSKLSARITLWSNRFLAVCMLVLLLLFPKLVLWYEEYRYVIHKVSIALTFGFYVCSPVVLYAIWCIEKLLTNILKERVFVTENVNCIRYIRWCCVLVSVICIPVAVIYTPMIFMVIIMAFLALIVSVVKNVLAAAVEIREENDLTI